MPRPFLSFAALLALAVVARADNWPQFRGPTGQGHTTDTDLPLKWSPTENVRWKVELPDQGNSTPAVWGERVFVTQASDRGLGDGGLSVGRKRALLCFARADGKL